MDLSVRRGRMDERVRVSERVQMDGSDQLGDGEESRTREAGRVEVNIVGGRAVIRSELIRNGRKPKRYLDCQLEIEWFLYYQEDRPRLRCPARKTPHRRLLDRPDWEMVI